MKKTVEYHEEIRAAFAKYIKQHREHIDVSRPAMAKLLGLKNVNFLAMIENGHSNIPNGQIASIAKAYGLDSMFAMMLIKHLQPEIWELFLVMLTNNLNPSDKKRAMYPGWRWLFILPLTRRRPRGLLGWRGAYV